MTRPSVAHLKREYLPRREPFVGYQIAALRRFRPVVVCRLQTRFDTYLVDPTFETTSQISPARRRVADSSYRFFRHLTAVETESALRFLVAHRASLLHAHYAVDAGFFLRLKQRSRLPLVVSCYGYDTAWFGSRWLGLGRRFLRRVYRAADVVLAMSPDMKADLLALGCPERKIRLHYYGVETESFACPDRTYEPGDLTVLSVAALEEYKGHAHLLRAFARVLADNPGLHARLRLVGDGPLKAKLEEQARSLGIAHRTEFVGFVPRGEPLYREYSSAAVFAMPSVTTESGEKEGVPGAMVEAMSAGLPVVASRHAGIPYVLDDGITGLIVPERDSVATAAAFGDLFRSRDLRKRLGSQACRVARERFDFRTRAAALEDIYLEQLESRR